MNPSVPMATATHELLIGWRMNSQYHPVSWVDGRRPSPESLASDCVKINPSHAAANAAIVAQSGSGKSFLVGRLIEEILVRTKARCTILDPNADFRSVWHLVAPNKWHKPHYDPVSRTGWLPTERNWTEFSNLWKKVSIQVCSLSTLNRDAKVRGLHSKGDIAVSWRDVPAEFIAGYLSTQSDATVAVCHESFSLVLDLLLLLQRKGMPPLDEQSSFDFAETLIAETPIENVTEALRILIARASQAPEPSAHFLHDRADCALKDPKGIAFLRSKRLVDSLTSRSYFAAAHVLIDSGLFTFSPMTCTFGSRLCAVDLASVPDPSCRLAFVSSTLSSIWRSARAEWENAMDKDEESDSRVPTFIVVDEAHHLIPRGSVGGLRELVLEQFRQVATEGRKFGVFLILLTQRPDRLDRIVAGECSNLAVMSLVNDRSIDETMELFGLDHSYRRELQKVREFPVGRCLLLGGWTPMSPQLMFTAARRTVEGGRNLRPESWTISPGA